VWKEKPVVNADNSSQKRTSGDAGLVTDKGDELVDSATSPLKLGGGDEGSDRG
jgi:hypothetical protein